MRHRPSSRGEKGQELNAHAPVGGVIARGVDRPGRNTRSVRLLRIALVASLATNVLLVSAFWLYVHYAATLSLIQDAIGFFE
jgi:hypothetical protein